MFRELSRQEIYQHVEALRPQEVWERARDFVLRVYGERAHTLEVEQLLTEPDVNSVRFSLVTEIEEWSVYDNKGNLLEPNPVPAFLQMYGSELQRAQKKETMQEKLLEIIRREINNVVPAEEVSYHFDLPPSIPFQAVYVDESTFSPLPTFDSR